MLLGPLLLVALFSFGVLPSGLNSYFFEEGHLLNLVLEAPALADCASMPSLNGTSGVGTIEMTSVTVSKSNNVTCKIQLQERDDNFSQIM